MSDLLDIHDKVDECVDRVRGLMIAAAGLQMNHERSGMSQLVDDLFNEMEAISEAIERVRTGDPAEGGA